MPYVRCGKCVYKGRSCKSKGKKMGCSDSIPKAKKYLKTIRWRGVHESHEVTELRQLVRTILLVEKSLRGRGLERVAKKIAREVTQALKDDEIKEIFARRGKIHFKLDYTPPEKVTWLRDVMIHMNQPVGNRLYNASAAYEYTKNAPEEERRNSDLILKLFMPTDYTDKDVDWFVTKYMGTIRHELEHSGQATEDIEATQKKIKDEEDIWASLENIEAYFIDKAETPAHISDWVLQAKQEGEEAADVIDWELQNIYATALHKGYTEEEMGPVMARIREIYQYYLMTRWPQQDWPAEMRDEDPDELSPEESDQLEDLVDKAITDALDEE